MQTLEPDGGEYTSHTTWYKMPSNAVFITTGIFFPYLWFGYHINYYYYGYRHFVFELDNNTQIVSYTDITSIMPHVFVNSFHIIAMWTPMTKSVIYVISSYFESHILPIQLGDECVSRTISAIVIVDWYNFSRAFELSKTPVTKFVENICTYA